MKKTIILIVVCILSLTSTKAQCKKLDIIKLIQLRTLEDKEYKIAMEALGFTENNSPSLVKDFDRVCTINGNSIKESMSKLVESSEDVYEVSLTYFIKDKATYDMLKKQIVANKSFKFQKSENKNLTSYKSKNDYIIFEETDDDFQINISNSF